MRGDRLLPDWLEQGTESSLRATADDAPRKAVPTAFGSSAPRGIASSSAHASPVVLTPMAGSPLPASARSAFTDLDKFYEESESEESETSEGGSEEDSEESEAEASSAPETESDDEDEATQEAGGLLHPA
jgi:AP-3 complex subunit beta